MKPACAVLEIAPSTYYAAKKREENPSARDELMKNEPSSQPSLALLPQPCAKFRTIHG